MKVHTVLSFTPLGHVFQVELREAIACKGDVHIRARIFVFDFSTGDESATAQRQPAPPVVIGFARFTHRLFCCGAVWFTPGLEL
jgi:hypothetical protein